MAFIWLAVFLVPVSGLLPPDHGRKSRRKSRVQSVGPWGCVAFQRNCLRWGSRSSHSAAIRDSADTSHVGFPSVTPAGSSCKTGTSQTGC